MVLFPSVCMYGVWNSMAYNQQRSPGQSQQAQQAQQGVVRPQATNTNKPAYGGGGGGGKGGGNRERKPSILLFKATDKETNEPKLSKGGKEYFRVVLTAEQVDILQSAAEGCALYMEEQSGTSKKTGKDYSGYAISVLPPRNT